MEKKRHDSGIDKSLIRTFLKYFKTYKVQSLGLVLMALLNLVSALIQPILWSYLLSTLFGRDLERLKVVIILMGGMYAVNAIVGYLQSVLTTFLNTRIINDMQNHIFNNLLSMNMKYFDDNSNGTFISKITVDIKQVVDLMMNQIVPAVVNIIKVLVLLTIMFGISMKLTLLSISVMPVLLYVYSRKSKTMREKQLEVRNSNDAVIGIIQQAVQGIRDIKALGLKEVEKEIFRKGNWNKSKKMYGFSIFVIRFQTLISLLGAIGELSIFAFGSYFVMTAVLSIEHFIQFTSYSQQFCSSSLSLITLGADYQKIIVSLRRLHEIEIDINKNHETFGDKEVSSKIPSVQFSKVSYRYDNDYVFKDADIKIFPNKITTLIGHSGCGKSTALNLMLGLYKPDSGCVLVNGCDINSLSEKSLRDQFTVVSQHPFIFNSSIKENFKYMNSDIQDCEIEMICKKCDIHDTIDSLPDKYNTVISENGNNFSIGQMQRLCIARALAKNAPILLLDEPTSALDEISANKIKELLNSLKNNRTILVISHNKELIDGSDYVFEINQKRILQRN